MRYTMTHIWHFYLEGFKSMTWGRVLWLIILIKLFIMFFILRLFFFPDFLKTNTTQGEESNYVSDELILRASK